MDHNKRDFHTAYCILVFIVLLYPSIVNSMKTNITQDNGMNIVGEKDEDNIKTGGIENENASLLMKREQHIPDNASKSPDLQTDNIGETALTVVPSVLGVLISGITFLVIMLILLVKKYRNEILLPEDASLLQQH